MRTPIETSLTAGQTATIPVETLLWCRQTMLASYSTGIIQIDRALDAVGIKVSTPAALQRSSAGSAASAQQQPLHNLEGTEQIRQRAPRRARTNTNTTGAATSSGSESTKSTALLNTYIKEAVNAMTSGGDLDQVEAYIRTHHPEYTFRRNILSMNLKRQWNGKFLKAVGQVHGKGANPTYYPLSSTVRGAVVGKGFKNQTTSQEPLRATG